MRTLPNETRGQLTRHDCTVESLSAVVRTRLTHGHVLILAANENQAKLSVDFEDLELMAGEALHLVPGQIYSIKGHANDDLWYVELGGKLCPPLFRRVLDAAVVDVSDRLALFCSLIADLKAQSDRRFDDHFLLASTASVLFAHIARIRRGPEMVSGRRQLYLALREEQERTLYYRPVSDYAKTLKVSSRSLARATTNEVGLSPKELLDCRLMLEAKRLLVLSSKSVAAIAKQLGFSESTNFIKFFIRHASVSPQEFRTAQLLADQSAAIDPRKVESAEMEKKIAV